MHVNRRLLNMTSRSVKNWVGQIHPGNPDTWTLANSRVWFWFMGRGLTICLWLGPPWFNYWFSFILAYSRINHEYSSLFIIVINLIFMFSLWCIDWVGSLYANRFFLCISVLRVASGPRVKLASCKNALTPPPPPPPRWFALLTVLRRWSRS